MTVKWHKIYLIILIPESRITVKNPKSTDQDQIP